MDLDDSSSPDEKEFPGLYDRTSSKSKGTEEGESATEFLTTKKSKDSKDKKSKEKKERQYYEALGGESEDDGEAKLFRSPSKSKKNKTFKFPSASKKEKREKSREPESKESAEKVKVKEDPKADKKKIKKDKEKKSKSNSLTSSDFELGGE